MEASRLARTDALLWAVIVVFLCLSAYDAAVCALAPCAFFEIGSDAALDAGRCLEEYRRVMLAWNLGVLPTAYGVGFVIAGRQFWRVLRAREAPAVRSRAEQTVAAASAASLSQHAISHSAMSLRGDGGGLSLTASRAAAWVCAASPDLFQDTLNSMCANNALIGTISIPFTLLILAIYVTVGVPDSVRGGGHAASELCGSNDLCAAALAYGPLLELFAFHMFTMPFIQFITTPAIVWGRVMDLAMRQVFGHNRLSRTPILTVTCLAVLSFHSVYSQVRIDGRGLNPTARTAASPAEVISFFFVQLAMLLFTVYLLWSCNILQDTYLYASRLSALALSHVIRPSYPAHISSMDGETSWRGHGRTLLVELSEASAEQRHETILLFTVRLLVHSRVLTGVPLPLSVTVLAEAVVLLCVLIFSKEKESSFEDLENGAGFGLVVSASSLLRVLSSHTKQGNTAAGLPHLRFHKATVGRMQSVMAVSYRWQDCHILLSSDGKSKLNMSPFQIGVLMSELRSSSMRYVWLDCLSVPQDESGLKYTLLARMMAVYAAAHHTLVIRSAESPYSRYHERAWTCQEFCAARRLKVFTEENGADNKYSVYGDEHMTIMELREQFQKSAQRVVPFWLRQEEAGPAAEAKASLVLDQFDTLSEWLMCKFDSDRIRALLPLLTLSPVESQQELAALVLQLSRQSGRPLQQMKAGLLDHHIIQTAGYDGGDGRMSIDNIRGKATRTYRKKKKRKAMHGAKHQNRKSSVDSTCTEQWVKTKTMFMTEEEPPAPMELRVERRSLSYGARPLTILNKPSSDLPSRPSMALIRPSIGDRVHSGKSAGSLSVGSENSQSFNASASTLSADYFSNMQPRLKHFKSALARISDNDARSTGPSLDVPTQGGHLTAAPFPVLATNNFLDKQERKGDFNADLSRDSDFVSSPPRLQQDAAEAGSASVLQTEHATNSEIGSFSASFNQDAQDSQQLQSHQMFRSQSTPGASDLPGVVNWIPDVKRNGLTKNPGHGLPPIPIDLPV